MKPETYTLPVLRCQCATLVVLGSSPSPDVAQKLHNRPGHLHTTLMRQYFVFLFLERPVLTFTLLPLIAPTQLRYELLYVFFLALLFFSPFPLDLGSRLL